MSRTNIPTDLLYSHIAMIESLYTGSKLTYTKIKEELDFLYGIKANISDIEKYYDQDADCKDCDEYVHYKNLGFA